MPVQAFSYSPSGLDNHIRRLSSLPSLNCSQIGIATSLRYGITGTISGIDRFQNRFENLDNASISLFVLYSDTKAVIGRSLSHAFHIAQKQFPPRTKRQELLDCRKSRGIVDKNKVGNA
jgi:hypothetical protein